LQLVPGFCGVGSSVQPGTGKTVAPKSTSNEAIPNERVLLGDTEGEREVIENLPSKTLRFRRIKCRADDQFHRFPTYSAQKNGPKVA